MIVIVMGVSGCGKSTVAAKIAHQMDADFLDADDLHPPENKKLMSSGIALTDENRLPWLKVVRDYATQRHQSGQNCIIACSALKKIYRDILNEAPSVNYVFLDGPKALIEQRMHERQGHFMPESLLTSQLEALESPDGEPNVVTIRIDLSPEEIAATAIAEMREAGFM